MPTKQNNLLNLFDDETLEVALYQFSKFELAAIADGCGLPLTVSLKRIPKRNLIRALMSHRLLWRLSYNLALSLETDAKRLSGITHRRVNKELFDNSRGAN
jgi:hypothetical protein